MLYDHMKKRRTAAALIIDETYPNSITPADYATALAHFGESPFDGEPILSLAVYATCLSCYGDGHVPNPAWRDDDEGPQEPEMIDCPQCRGGGFVKIVAPLAPISTDDDLPF